MNIFDGLEEKDIEKILKNLEGEKKLFEKNRKIASNKDNVIGIIINGEANLEKYDYNGNRLIVEKLERNSLFGELFYKFKNDTILIAKTDCEVLFFKYDNFIKKNKNINILINMNKLLSEKILNLNTRIEILSKRSIKDKLLSYFSYLTNYKKNKSFLLPLTYTDLADYLAIDRSAMMREIKKLKEERYIKTNGKKITLITF